MLVGSKRGIPWVELFEPDLAFRLERVGPGWTLGFRNQHPQQEELQTYATREIADGSYETYATISLVPNVSHTGDVLLLDGTMTEATEAAGEFVMNPCFGRVLQSKLGAGSAPRIPHLELLLKIRARSGAPSGVEVVAARTRPAN